MDDCISCMHFFNRIIIAHAKDKYWIFDVHSPGNQPLINKKSECKKNLPWVLCILFLEMPQVQFYLHSAADISSCKISANSSYLRIRNCVLVETTLFGDHSDIQILYFHKSKFLFEKVSIVEIFFGFEQRRFDHFVSIVTLNSIDFLRNMCKRKIGQMSAF